MKKLIAYLLPAALLFASCHKTDLVQNETDDDEYTAPVARKCASNDVLEKQLAEDPNLRIRMDEIEGFVKRFEQNPDRARLVNGVMEIPVVVNVLYRNASENIAQAQIQSQIDVLNEDFGGTNSDISLVPAGFTGVKAFDTKIRFVLETVVRKSSNKRSWGTNDAMKKSSQGGINPTSPTTKLNIWVCTLGGGILGYAQFPGGSAATDGVVVLNQAFGSRAKYSGGYYTSTYDKGRTTTHEVGHWLNLRHIWGDATCGNDGVGDTPLHNTANYGCPAAGHRSTCTGTPVEMTMNYMDYTDDACMYMFTLGQKTRMEATWAVGGPRASFR